MPAHRLLKNAPVKEAVIDFRAQVNFEFTPEKVKNLKNAFGYTGQTQDLLQASVGFAFKDGKPVPGPASSTQVRGAKFTSADGKLVAQLRNDGLTFSRLHPYTRWEEIFPEACRIWKICAATAEIKSVSRIAVRYINKLSFPSAEFSSTPERYLNPPPSQPPGTSGIITEWITRFVIVDADGKNNAIVTQMSDREATDPERYSIIFDIDVFAVKGLPAVSEEAALLERFEALRTLKNKIFFNALTDNAVNLYT